MKERLQDLFNKMSTDELIYIHNEYCDAVNACDDRIYLMDEFDEIMSGVEPWEIARSVFFGSFNPTYDYFKFNGYGNLQSIYEYEIKDYIDLDAIIDYIIDNNDSLYNDDVQEILDECATDDTVE